MIKKMLKQLENWLNKIKGFIAVMIIAASVVAFAAIFNSLEVWHYFAIQEALASDTVSIPYLKQTELKTRNLKPQGYTVSQVKEIISVVAEQEEFDVGLLQRMADCESDWVWNQRGKVDKNDRGVFQINKTWNPDVTDQQADDPWFATRWTINEIREGRLWKWDASKTCWNN